MRMHPFTKEHAWQQVFTQACNIMLLILIHIGDLTSNNLLMRMQPCTNLFATLLTTNLF